MKYDNLYIIDTENVWQKPLKKYLDMYVCPCCNYPTLTERNSYEICGICDWEDDGQDDNNADHIAGGPNSDYSLTEARENFKQYLTMYRPADTKPFNHFDKSIIKEIIGIYERVLLDQTLPNENAKELFREAKRLEDNLRKLK